MASFSLEHKLFSKTVVASSHTELIQKIYQNSYLQIFTFSVKQIRTSGLSSSPNISNTTQNHEISTNNNIKVLESRSWFHLAIRLCIELTISKINI